MTPTAEAECPRGERLFGVHFHSDRCLTQFCHKCMFSHFIWYSLEITLLSLHGYISFGYPTPLPTAILIPLQRMPHMCLMSLSMCGAFVTALLPVWSAGSLLWAWNQGSSICGRIKWKAAIFMELHSKTSPLPLEYFSCSCRSRKRSQDADAYTYFISRFSCSENIMWYIPEGRKRLAFHKCYTTTLTPGQGYFAWLSSGQLWSISHV